MADATTTAKVIDFTNVKDSTGAAFSKRRMPAGDYAARIVKVQDAESKKDGGFQWLFTIALEGHPTAKYPYYCKLEENQLWKVRNICIAAGLNVPKKKVKLDPSKLLDKLIAVTLEDDEYDGKSQSVIAAVFPPSELEDAGEPEVDDEDEEDEEEEAPAPARKKAAPAPADDEDEEEDEEEEAAPPVRKAKKQTVTEDELDELDIDDI